MYPIRPEFHIGGCMAVVSFFLALQSFASELAPDCPFFLMEAMDPPGTGSRPPLPLYAARLAPGTHCQFGEKQRVDNIEWLEVRSVRLNRGTWISFLEMHIRWGQEARS